MAELSAPSASIEQFAEVSAEIAEGDRPLTEILGLRGLSPEVWREVSAFYTRLIADAMESDDTGPADLFTAAFVRAQDAQRPIAPMTPEEWAALVMDVSRAGTEPVLSARGISSAHYLRLSRHWAKVLAGDKAQAQRYFQAFYALEAHRAAAH
jgi:hypothetical protein